MINSLKFLTIFLAMAIYVLSPYICFAENSLGSSLGGFCSVKTASRQAETMERFPPHTTKYQQSTTNHQLPTTNYPPSTTITYFYDGDEIENEEDSTGDMSTYLTRSVRGVVDTTGNVNVNYLISNAKDVIGETDSTGNNITTTYNYDAYGKSVDFATNPQPLSSFSISDNPFQYSGYYCDKESGLYYLKARYYSPELMTFISMDTYDLANKYSYGNNDPIDGIDPNGHSFLKYLLTGICALALINPEIWPALSAMAPQELVQLYTPETVAKALNIAIAAAYTTAAIITLGVTAYQAGTVIAGSVLESGIGAALQLGQLANTCVKYNQYAQLAVGYALMIAGLALMAYGYRSASLNNQRGGNNSLVNGNEEQNKEIYQKKEPIVGKNMHEEMQNPEYKKNLEEAREFFKQARLQEEAEKKAVQNNAVSENAKIMTDLGFDEYQGEELEAVISSNKYYYKALKYSKIDPDGVMDLFNLNANRENGKFDGEIYMTENIDTVRSIAQKGAEGVGSGIVLIIDRDLDFSLNEQKGTSWHQAATKNLPREKVLGFFRVTY